MTVLRKARTPVQNPPQVLQHPPLSQTTSSAARPSAGLLSSARLPAPRLQRAVRSRPAQLPQQMSTPFALACNLRMSNDVTGSLCCSASIDYLDDLLNQGEDGGPPPTGLNGDPNFTGTPYNPVNPGAPVTTASASATSPLSSLTSSPPTTFSSSLVTSSRTTALPSFVSCSTQNADPDNGIAQGYCVCSGSTFAQSTNAAVTPANYCAYTVPLPISTTSIATLTTTPVAAPSTPTSTPPPSPTSISGASPTDAL